MLHLIYVVIKRELGNCNLGDTVGGGGGGGDGGGV